MKKIRTFFQDLLLRIRSGPDEHEQFPGI